MYGTYPEIEEWNKKYTAYEMRYAGDDSKYEWDGIDPEDAIEKIWKLQERGSSKPMSLEDLIDRKEKIENTECYVMMIDEESFEGLAIPVAFYDELIKKHEWIKS